MTVSFAVLCIGPPQSSKRYFSPRNTCIVEETCSGISLRIISVAFIVRVFFYLTPPLRQPFRSSFDQQTGTFPLDRWSVFLIAWQVCQSNTAHVHQLYRGFKPPLKTLSTSQTSSKSHFFPFSIYGLCVENEYTT